MQMNRYKVPRTFWILHSISWPALLLLVVVLLFIVPVVAQDKPAAETRPVTVDNQVNPTASEAESESSDKQQSGQPIPPAIPRVTGPAAKPVKEFKPSETIGADSAVSFPVDI